jgi:hypothetical protein
MSLISDADFTLFKIRTHILQNDSDQQTKRIVSVGFQDKDFCKYTADQGNLYIK